MINEIYINNKLIENGTPRKKFKQGYKIRCISCKELIDRKWYDKKILEDKYECKSCVLKNRNPMHNPEIKKKHDDIVKSKEYRENMSKSVSGKNNGFYGKTHNKESIEKIIQANKDYWESMTDDERDLRAKQNSIREQKKMKKDPIGYRKKRAKAARISHKSQFENMNMNGIETTVYDYLIDNGIEVNYSVILASYQFDFGIKNERILIEVDGDYWHGNPKMYNRDGSNGKRKLNEIQLGKIEQDKEKTKWAISRGFTLIRIWEEEVNNGTFKKKLNSYIDEIKEN